MDYSRGGRIHELNDGAHTREEVSLSAPLSLYGRIKYAIDFSIAYRVPSWHACCAASPPPPPVRALVLICPRVVSLPRAAQQVVPADKISGLKTNSAHTRVSKPCGCLCVFELNNTQVPPCGSISNVCCVALHEGYRVSRHPRPVVLLFVIFAESYCAARAATAASVLSRLHLHRYRTVWVSR